MKINRTLKQELKRLADFANTPTEVTNRIVKECREIAVEGGYTNSVYIETAVAEQVLANLKNEFTDLDVELEHGNWYTISWED
jgi:glutamine synthetase type III